MQDGVFPTDRKLFDLRDELAELMKAAARNATRQTRDISIERLKIMSRNVGQLESRFEKLDVYIDFKFDKSIRDEA